MSVQVVVHVCGGSLVASSWVLTDIRVLITQKDIRIILGQIFMCVISRLILTSYFGFIIVCGLLPLLLPLLLPHPSETVRWKVTTSQFSLLCGGWPEPS